MFQNKTDILLFLIYIGILIFAEKITDHHHAYNRRSEITLQSLTQYIKQFKHRILETLRSIVTGDKAEKISNKFLVYEAIVKMKYIGKCE